jgi:type IV pilus assembly protein PilC
MVKKLFIGSSTEKQKVEKKSSDEKEQSVFEELNFWVAKQGRLKVKDKVTFYRLFSTMINAGVNITKALSILYEQVETPKLKVILEDVGKRIQKGQTLSDSLQSFDKDFSNAEIGMIRSGEASGKLNEALLNLADQTEKSANITKKLKGAMIYPAVVFVLLIIALFAVMTFVMPQIKDMFANFNAKLPAATQMLIDMSDFFVAHGGPFDLPNVINVVICVVLFVMLIGYLRTTQQGLYYWDLMLLYLPVFGTLNKKVAISKMCRGLATLISSGIPIVKAIIICSDMIGNELYRLRILRIADDVKVGINIADNMRGDHMYFPPMVVSMVGVGEQTAQLDKITKKMAEFYEDEVDDMIKNISALLEPIIIVVVGLSVGGLVIAVMRPILSLSDLDGGG